MALMSRRTFLASTALVGVSCLAGVVRQRSAFAQGTAPALVTSDSARPTIPYGVASGEVTSHTAMVWSRTNRPGRLLVEYATTEAFKQARLVQGPVALAVSDFTARVELTDLPAGQEIFYRVTFQDLADPKMLSAPVLGHLRTAPTQRRDVTFAWSGDTAGQGWGINPEWGGMRIYEQIRRLQPDFFIHNGDYIYADGPIQAEVKLDDGTLWKNITLPEKAKVAETLAEFRGNYVYNLLDEHIRRFNAEVPQIVQWDDHETTNNWFPGGMLDERNPRFKHYTVKSHDLLAAYARRAFCEHTPMRFDPHDPERIYRMFHYGPSLDIFMLDERSLSSASGAPLSPRSRGPTAPLASISSRLIRAGLQRGHSPGEGCAPSPAGGPAGPWGGRGVAARGPADAAGLWAGGRSGATPVQAGLQKYAWHSSPPLPPARPAPLRAVQLARGTASSSRS